MATTNEQSQIHYATFCSTCHGREGEGSANVIPASAGNSTVLASNPASLINIILDGGSTANTQTHIGYAMPGYDWLLDDQQVADMANLLRASWGIRLELLRSKTLKDNAKSECLNSVKVKPGADTDASTCLYKSIKRSIKGNTNSNIMGCAFAVG